MNLRKAIGVAHLWLGLLSGSVVCLIALSGAVYAFEEEIRYLFEREYWFVEAPADRKQVPLSRLKAAADALFHRQTPGADTLDYTDARFYADPTRAVAFLYYNDEPPLFKEVFTNPYSGEVLHCKDHSQDLFRIALELHTNLLLGEVGKEIVDWATLVFFFQLIGGLILWWPRTRAAGRQRFTIRWGASPKRLNHDLHNVLGFYATWVAIFLVLTGFTWAFPQFTRGVEWLANGGQASPDQPKILSDTLSVSQPKPEVMDQVYGYALTQLPRARRFFIAFPEKPADPYNLSAVYAEETYYEHRHVYFDQTSGQVLHDTPYDQMTSGEKLVAMVYDIHMGKILGLPGQLLVFFASLLVASLPITGLRIWLGRRKGKGERGPSPPVRRLPG